MYALSRTNRRNGFLAPFEDLFGELFGAVPTTTHGWVPALDFAETPEAYVVHVELPGVDPEGVDISIVDDRLELRGLKTVEKKEEQEGWYRLERRQGSFSRTVPLPGHVDTKHVTAEAKNGVLTITLPKREEAKARKVPVQVAR
ncbi:MAG: Hsp20/alpha crystallin family protein [Planctomycetota bacterium]